MEADRSICRYFMNLYSFSCSGIQGSLQHNLGSSGLQEGNQKQQAVSAQLAQNTEQCWMSLSLFVSHFTEWFHPSRRLHSRSVQSVPEQPLPSAWDRPHLLWVVRKDSHSFIYFIYLFSPFTDFLGWPWQSRLFTLQQHAVLASNRFKCQAGLLFKLGSRAPSLHFWCFEF